MNINICYLNIREADQMTEKLDRTTINPEILNGQPCIYSTVEIVKS